MVQTWQPFFHLTANRSTALSVSTTTSFSQMNIQSSTETRSQRKTTQINSSSGQPLTPQWRTTRFRQCITWLITSSGFRITTFLPSFSTRTSPNCKRRELELQNYSTVTFSFTNLIMNCGHKIILMQKIILDHIMDRYSIWEMSILIFSMSLDSNR